MDKKILLIADDEEMNRKIISKFLKDDFEVIEAPNGRVAVEIMNERHVDALLLDIIMPEMDGFEVLKHLEENPKLHHIGVLVATSTKEKTERSVLSLGADDVVSKPYDPVVIRKRMANIIAVKEVQVQKTLLQNHNMDEFLQKRDEKVMKQVDLIIKKIKQFADVIKGNEENIELVSGAVDEIKREADNVMDVFASAK